MPGNGGAADRRFMEIALRLADRALGRTAPNPAVGCAIVKDGIVRARGWTQPGGRPHAEAHALAQIQGRARGASAYITLEPCAHHGRTPPCVEALVKAGIARAVIAMTDPDPRTAGRGVAALRQAGIAVETGLGGDAAARINRGFILRLTAGRPLVSLKLATAIDGRIAAGSGHARWITGAQARRHAHLLRARHDAVLVGGRTQRQDDPLLTCRLDGLENASPVRIVLTTRARLDPASRLMRTADRHPLWLLTPEKTTPAYPPPDPEDPSRPGLYTLPFAAAPGDPEERRADQILAALARAGITRLLVEGGAQVARLFLATGRFDRLYHYTGNCLIGADGVPAVPPLGVRDVARDAPRLRLLRAITLEESVLAVYEPLDG